MCHLIDQFSKCNFVPPPIDELQSRENLMNIYWHTDRLSVEKLKLEVLGNRAERRS